MEALLLILIVFFVLIYLTKSDDPEQVDYVKTETLLGIVLYVFGGLKIFSVKSTISEVPDEAIVGIISTVVSLMMLQLAFLDFLKIKKD